jgi:hypothetical protein
MPCPVECLTNESCLFPVQNSVAARSAGKASTVSSEGAAGAGLNARRVKDGLAALPEDCCTVPELQ